MLRRPQELLQFPSATVSGQVSARIRGQPPSQSLAGATTALMKNLRLTAALGVTEVSCTSIGPAIPVEGVPVRGDHGHRARHPQHPRKAVVPGPPSTWSFHLLRKAGRFDARSKKSRSRPPSSQSFPIPPKSWSSSEPPRMKSFPIPEATVTRNVPPIFSTGGGATHDPGEAAYAGPMTDNTTAHIAAASQTARNQEFPHLLT
jgi:hypothetical protein